MKKIIYIAIAVSVLFASCRKPVLIPAIGLVEGTVVDIHGSPVIGAEIKIKHTPGSEESEPSEETIATTTDFEGHFIIDEVWDDFRIDIKHPGFEGQSKQEEISRGDFEKRFDFTLIGSPEQSEIFLSRDTFLSTDTIGLSILVKVEDEYNDLSSGYNGNLMFTDSNSVLHSVFPLTVKAEGVGEATLEYVLFPDSLMVGTFGLSARVSDPDGNEIFTSSTEKLLIE